MSCVIGLQQLNAFSKKYFTYLRFVVNVANFFHHELKIVVPWQRTIDHVRN